MERLESELRRELRRIEPPDGFTVRVMQRVRAERLPTRKPWRRWGTIGAIAASMLFGVYAFQERREGVRAEQAEAVQAEQAEAELLYALQLAGHTVNRATDAVLPLSLASEERP